MGYDVHITRADQWTDSENCPISLDEWLGHVARDPEMRLDNVATVSSPQGDIIRYENEGLAVWTAHSQCGIGGDMAAVWFDYREGRIVVKNPDEEILGKIRQIARTLHARVQGDEGEYYD